MLVCECDGKCIVIKNTETGVACRLTEGDDDSMIEMHGITASRKDWRNELVPALAQRQQEIFSAVRVG